MPEFRSPVPLPDIPDHLTIPQFILRSGGIHDSPSRPVRPRNTPFFIEDHTGRGILYEEVHHRTYRLANALSIKWKLGPNDIVCLFSPNHIDYATTIWAVHTLGGIITPANPAYTADELRHQLVLTKAKLIAVHPEYLSTAVAAAHMCGLSEACFFLLAPSISSNIPTVDQLVSFGVGYGENYRAIRLKPGEASKTIAFLSFSSGTTGKPKAVAISHYSVIANILQMATHYRINDPTWPSKALTPGEVVLGALPFFHIFGLVVNMHYALYCGVCNTVSTLAANISDLQPRAGFYSCHTQVQLPRIFAKYREAQNNPFIHPEAKGRDFSHVKFCLSGAAPLSGELMSHVSKIFPNAVIGQGYGLTETATTVCSIRHDSKLGTVGGVGVLIPGITAKIIKADGTLAKEGEQGELVVKGPNMAMGYYENPTATAETFVDGWVRTGDEVIIRNLEVFVVDRLKEIMKVRGFQVAPAELEGYLLLHPDIADACVVGIPDEYSGEIPLAFVVLTADGLKRIEIGEIAVNELKQEIKKHVSAAKVQYKWLAGGVEFVDAIPKNPSGKILRRVLRDHAKSLLTSKPLLTRL